MIVSEIYEMDDMLIAVVLKQEYSAPQIIRIVEVPDLNLTPEFFVDARRGFPNNKEYNKFRSKRITWDTLERYTVLVASINNRGGVAVFEDSLMKKRARDMFGVKARCKYARKFPTKAADCGFPPLPTGAALSCSVFRTASMIRSKSLSTLGQHVSNAVRTKSTRQQEGGHTSS